MNTDRHLKNELSELAAERNARKIKELREGSTEKPIDWQKVRIQAAIVAMQGILASKTMMKIIDETVRIGELNGKEVSADSAAAKISVGFADALVKELKGE